MHRGVPVIDSVDAHTILPTSSNAFALRWHFNRIISSGEFQKILREQVPASKCQALVNPDNDAVRFTEMIGAWASLGFFMALGVVTTGLQLVVHRTWVDAHERIIDPPRPSTPVIVEMDDANLDAYLRQFSAKVRADGKSVPGL